MLISFSLSNFKGFKRLESIDLKPLTVICGPNNSGKSSIIQSLLLMKQSRRISRILPPLPVTDIRPPLILDGKNVLAHLGNWEDVIYKHEKHQKMAFTWKLCGGINNAAHHCNNDYLEAEMAVEIDLVEDDTHATMRVSRFQFNDLTTNFSFELVKTKTAKYKLTLTGLSASDLQALKDKRTQTENIAELAPNVIPDLHFQEVLVSFGGIFPKLLEAVNLADLTFEHGVIPGPHWILAKPSYRCAIQLLQDFWSKLRYIGPLRARPKRYYAFDSLMTMNIGVKGEYTPYVLAFEQEQPVPPYYQIQYAGPRIKEYELRESDNLREALNGWLVLLKLPQLIPTPPLKRGITQMKLNANSVAVDLPDVGFGVSQILPVLVECLRMKAGETIVLEQPEIHLHPSLQSKLADFFICMVKSGKHIILETHSEHLIKRLYLRVAQEKSNDLGNLLNTLFVHFDEQQQCSVVKPITINEYDEIENWPVGFFDEDDSRELVAATLKKRMGKLEKP